MVQVRDVTGPSSFRDIVPVYIDVDDINDNHPRFVQRQYKLDSFALRLDLFLHLPFGILVS